MTVHSPASDFRLASPTEFACIRSEFIDEFARLEIAVGCCLQKLELEFDSRKCCFEQLVEKLSKAKPSPRLSKKQAAELAHLPEMCRPLQYLRASVVHGIMEIVNRDNVELALFRNAADVIKDIQICYALTSADFRARIETLAGITRQVRAITSPPSPPQRAPAAAADP